MTRRRTSLTPIGRKPGFWFKGISFHALYASRDFSDNFSVASRIVILAIVFAILAETYLKQMKFRLKSVAYKPADRGCNVFSRLFSMRLYLRRFQGVTGLTQTCSRQIRNLGLRGKDSGFFLWATNIQFFPLIVSFGDKNPEDSSTMRFLMTLEIFPVSINLLNCFHSPILPF